MILLSMVTSITLVAESVEKGLLIFALTIFSMIGAFEGKDTTVRRQGCGRDGPCASSESGKTKAAEMMKGGRGNLLNATCHRIGS